MLSNDSVERLESRRLLATAGLVDTSFGGDGLIDTDMGFIQFVLTPAAGKTLVMGWGRTGDDLVMRQYKSDGSLDTSFSGDGKLTVSQAGGAFAALVQADGKILVNADNATVEDGATILLRFNPNGSLDSTFGGGDGIAPSNAGIGTMREMVQQPDGKIVAVANYRTAASEPAEIALLRYNIDGTPDPTFYGGGRRVGIQKIGGWFSNPSSIYVSDAQLAIGAGKIYLALDMYAGILGTPHSYVYRFDGNGNTDPSMGTTLFYNPTGDFEDDIDDLAVAADGKLLMMGTAHGHWAMWKLNWPAWNDLYGDSTFDGDGKVLDTFAGYPRFMKVRPDGKIVVGGNVFQGETGTLLLTRYNTNGSVDSTFGTSGKTSTSFNSKHQLLDMAIDSNGAIAMASMVYGLEESSFHVARFTGDIALPPPPPASGSIAGTVFKDGDADGVKETGDTGLGGWKAFIDADKDGVLDTGEKTATTDSSGNYKFTGLAAGSYRVREVTGSGWRRTSPSAGYHTVTLASGQAGTGKNFGNTQNVLISGTIWNDLDGDGVKDVGDSATTTEPVLSGWKVYIDANKNGLLDTGEKTATTNSSGVFEFSLLPAGTYRLREVLPSGWRRTAPSSGYFDLTLGNGASATGKNFGNTQKILISGSVFNDADGDRVKDSTEAKLSGWRVFIDADGDGIYDSGEKSVLTDTSGNFSFKSLAAGTYNVRVVQQSGWTRTTPTSGYFSITLSAGASSTGKLFGERKIA